MIKFNIIIMIRIVIVPEIFNKLQTDNNVSKKRFWLGTRFQPAIMHFKL